MVGAIASHVGASEANANDCFVQASPHRFPFEGSGCRSLDLFYNYNGIARARNSARSWGLDVDSSSRKKAGIVSRRP
jgi:hypothetical protein